MKVKVLVGIKNCKETDKWGCGLIIKKLDIEKGKRVTVVIVFNIGRIREVIEELRDIVEELEMGGGAILLIGNFNLRIWKWQISEEEEANE